MATILLVDDDEDLAFAIKLWLERKNHKIEVASAGLEALEQMKYGQFDLIILDGHLPDMEGIDVCRQFRSSGGAVPILMLSGIASEKDINAGLAAGANDYLAKPFAMKELTLRMESLLVKMDTK